MKRLWVGLALAALQAGILAGSSLDQLIQDFDSVHPAPARTPLPRAGAAPAAEPDVWARLLAGNARFAKGQSHHPHLGAKRRQSLAKAEAPEAIILASSDSRVAPELIFDQGLGDLFVVRAAGDLAGPSERASLEYAVGQLHSHLLVVLDAGAAQRLLEQSPVLQKAVKAGELKVRSARYSLDSGRVEPLD